MVCVIRPRLARLRDELGRLADGVRFVDMGELGRNPARIIPAWQQFVDECAVEGQPVRGVGEPIWAGRRPGEVSECQLHEALLDIAVPPETPLWLLCPYDVGELEEEVLAEARRTHPGFLTSGVARRRGWFAGEHRADDGFHVDLPQAGAPTFRRSFTATDLRVLRDDVLPRPSRGRVGRAQRRPRTVRPRGGHQQRGPRPRCGCAAHLARARCSGVRGPRPGSDQRSGDRPPGAGRREPARTGLWMVNQLCDLVQIRSHAAGTTVRLHTWL